MGRTRAWVALAVAPLVSLAACGGDDGGARPSAPITNSATSPPTKAATATPSATSLAAPYRSQHFVPRFIVAPPPWLPPEPVIDDRHFLTWVGEGADIDRAVRFMSPVGIYDPGHHPAG